MERLSATWRVRIIAWRRHRIAVPGGRKKEMLERPMKMENW